MEENHPVSLHRTMAAALLTGHGGLERLEYRTDVPVPRPEEGKVLIQVAAAGINNTDVNPRIGWYSKAVTSGTGEGGGGRVRRHRRRGRHMVGQGP
ncbi:MULTISPECIES: hypothetical protein [Streptomyces]|uniref:hypothetical protein n=1 Tax=Streptomyces TaxID=1883 RepID=UPI00287FB189|nr:hypothetical protein [Streptomyces sp. CGMCC 4.1456]WNF66720.1 hypothetical protein RJD14_30955 [Streptomyces sp. CGMCC 4.1456]